MANARQRAEDAAVSMADRVDEAGYDGRFRDADWRSGLMETERWQSWRRPRWWLLPLIALPLWIVGFIWAFNHIENDVEAAAPRILEEQGIDASRLSFEADYRDVTVSGELPEGVTAADVERALEDNDYVGGEDEDIREADVEATAPIPAELGAVDVTATSADGESMTLRGSVPSEDHKAELLAAASATGLTVIDELTVSGLEPSADDADAQIKKMSSVIGGLAAGTFAAADLALGNDGPVTGSIDALDAATAASLESVAGDGVNVTAPPELAPLDVDVNFDGSRIVLNGTVFSEDERAALVTAAASVVGEENVVDNLVISDLGPEVEGTSDRVGALAAGISTFGGLESADGSLTDTDLTINGVALDDAAQQATTDALAAAADSGVRPGGEITVVEVEEPEFTLEEEIELLQAELDALQDEIRENVRFDTDSDGLSPAAQGTLDKVVDAMQRYQRPVVEVGGHTDSQGTDEYNIALSQERADAVSAYLGSAGIDTARLKGTGFGESQPIADNTLEEGRRINRRVEFIAKAEFE